MTDTERIQQWEAEENFAFQGWDFSHLDKRWDVPEPPWDYKGIVRSYLKDAHILLDMGTGGGEVLLSINHPYQNTYVTEAYEPNYALCKQVLSPLGITVVRTYPDQDLHGKETLPFQDNFFDVVINRHESFDLSEVDRVLKPGGYFITQQVGGGNLREFELKLNDDFTLQDQLPTHKRERYTSALASLGYQILCTDEIQYPVKFYDVGALVFYAKVIPWSFPGFSVKTHLHKLQDCQREVEAKGFLQGTGHRFYFVAQKK